MCHTHAFGSYAQGQGRYQVRGQNRVSAITKKLLKVCCAQELGSYTQGQGHNHVRGQIVPEIVLLINYSSKFDETSQKDEA